MDLAVLLYKYFSNIVPVLHILFKKDLIHTVALDLILTSCFPNKKKECNSHIFISTVTISEIGNDWCLSLSFRLQAEGISHVGIFFAGDKASQPHKELENLA